MTDISEQRLLKNRCGSMSLVYESRAYILKRIGKKEEILWIFKTLCCIRGQCGQIWKSARSHGKLPGGSPLSIQNEKEENFNKTPSAAKTTTIPTIYDQETSTASADPCASGQFLMFQRVWETILPSHRHDQQILDEFQKAKSGEDFLLYQIVSKHILVFAAGNKTSTAGNQQNLRHGSFMYYVFTQILRYSHAVLDCASIKADILHFQTSEKDITDRPLICMLNIYPSKSLPEVDGLSGASFLKNIVFEKIFSSFRHYVSRYLHCSHAVLDCVSLKAEVWTCPNRLTSLEQASGIAEPSALNLRGMCVPAEPRISSFRHYVFTQILRCSHAVLDCASLKAEVWSCPDMSGLVDQSGSSVWNRGTVLYCIFSPNLPTFLCTAWQNPYVPITSPDKQGCDGAISTNLEVTVVLKQRAHMEIWPVDEHVAYIMEKKAILKKRCAEETKSIPAIYDEEASAASTEQSTSDHFPAFQPDRNSVYNLQLKSISFVINRQARTSSNWQK
ncbi:hypothetical protein T11_7172 [Trichinella zimbabwensis]|uniref:Uncharacterized protein n=1 Tax=Trichinella zimbabwensis TaxID=268475 RepID=A0A0V1HLL8_9BILA|nr:hypothetical protein T11_7172 [Trichinella zimbabwensis]